MCVIGHIVKWINPKVLSWVKWTIWSYSFKRDNGH